MKKFIPYEKLSKKKQRELDALRRNVWTISPVTRKPENSKAYNRKKAQKWNDDSGFCAFCIIYSIFCYCIAGRRASTAARDGMEGRAPCFVVTR